MTSTRNRGSVPAALRVAVALWSLLLPDVTVRPDMSGHARALAAAPSAAAESSPLVIGPFSSAKAGGAMPAGWEPLEFKKIPEHTSYRLVEDGGTVVVQAESRASASGLVCRVRVDPRERPIVAWRWKALNLIDRADVTTKAGDDYPVRLYITFAYDPAKLGLIERAKFETARLLYGEYPPLAAISYVWDGKAPAGAIVPNAYTARVKMIVVESGAAKLGRWVEESRDLGADYRAAFGGDPPPISGVAIMTDTDNTGESATAFYGDIVFRERTGATPQRRP